MEIEEDLEIIIDCYHKKENLYSSIILVMENIWNHNLNIYNCYHVYKETKQ